MNTAWDRDDSAFMWVKAVVRLAFPWACSRMQSSADFTFSSYTPVMNTSPRSSRIPILSVSGRRRSCTDSMYTCT